MMSSKTVQLLINGVKRLLAFIQMDAPHGMPKFGVFECNCWEDIGFVLNSKTSGFEKDPCD